MKKRVVFLLTLCMFLLVTACGNGSSEVNNENNDVIHENDDEPTYTDEDSQDTLESVAGWWTKPEDYEGLTALYTFCVNVENKTITSYDDYGNAYEEMDCWYDAYGFNIDGGEFWGIITYTFDGDELLDDEGNVQYVRCDPIDPNNAPFSLSDLAGVWYKNGEDYTTIVVEDESYRIEIMELVQEAGTARIVKHTTYFDASEYTGPTLSLENESGFSSDFWILDEGNVLYDDFHGEYYLKEVVEDEDNDYLSQKYALIRDSWSSNGDESYMLTFKFFGELWLHTPNDDATYTTEVIGTWEFNNGIIQLNYTNGSIEEIEPADEIYVENLAMSFTRWPAW